MVAMDVWPPPVPYFFPTRPFIFGAIKGHIASEDDLRVGGIHGENREADTTGAIGARGDGAAVSLSKAIRWDLGPRRPAVKRFGEVMVWVAGAQ